jgi:hypothetical protein
MHGKDYKEENRMPTYEEKFEQGEDFGNGFHLNRDLRGIRIVQLAGSMGCSIYYSVQIGKYDFESSSYNPDDARKGLTNQIVNTYLRLEEAKTTKKMLYPEEEELRRELSDLLTP